MKRYRVAGVSIETVRDSEARWVRQGDRPRSLEEVQAEVAALNAEVDEAEERGYCYPFRVYEVAPFEAAP